MPSVIVLVALEVESSLRIDLSDLHYSITIVTMLHFASKGLHELLNVTEEIYHPLTCVASLASKNMSYTWWN